MGNVEEEVRRILRVSRADEVRFAAAQANTLLMLAAWEYFFERERLPRNLGDFLEFTLPEWIRESVHRSKEVMMKLRRRIDEVRENIPRAERFVEIGPGNRPVIDRGTLINLYVEPDLFVLDALLSQLARSKMPWDVIPWPLETSGQRVLETLGERADMVAALCVLPHVAEGGLQGFMRALGEILERQGYFIHNMTALVVDPEELRAMEWRKFLERWGFQEEMVEEIEMCCGPELRGVVVGARRVKERRGPEGVVPFNLKIADWLSKRVKKRMRELRERSPQL